MLYSPDSAVKGVTMAITKAPKARAIDDFGSEGAAHATIIAPHSLPMFKEDGAVGASAGGRGTKRQREKERHDPQKTLKPSTPTPALADVSTSLTLPQSIAVPPVVGPGRGGRIGAAATQHVVQNLLRNEMRDQDVSESLLVGRFSGLTCSLHAASRSAAQVCDAGPRREYVDQGVGGIATEAGL